MYNAYIYVSIFSLLPGMMTDTNNNCSTNTYQEFKIKYVKCLSIFRKDKYYVKL